MTKGFAFGALAVVAMVGAGCAELLIGDVLVEEQATAGGDFYDVQYRCRGEQKTASVPGAPVSDAVFCVGDAQLAVLDDAGNIVATWRTSASKDEDAPVLGDVTSLGSDRLLIYFAKDECSTVNNCGVGTPYPAGTHVVDVSEGSLDELENMPDGNPIWNSDETKAVIIPSTCGGGGCGLAALVGYDILVDEQTTLTTEKGADEVYAQDAVGNDVPYWKSVTWKDNDSVVAVLVLPDGTEDVVDVEY